MQNWILWGIACIRSTRWRGDATRRTRVRTRAQRGCWPAHFWMTLLRMRYLLSTPRDRPPPLPHPVIDYTRLFTRSIHGPIGPLFIRREGRYWLCLSTSYWEPRGASSDKITWSWNETDNTPADAQHLSFVRRARAPVDFTSSARMCDWDKLKAQGAFDGTIYSFNNSLFSPT